MIGVRGLHEMIVATFGGQPDRSSSRLTAQASAVRPPNGVCQFNGVTSSSVVTCVPR